MENFSNTINLMVDRMETIYCEHCGCEIDVSDLSALDKLECPECALHVTVACRLGPYLLQERLGAGAMGTIYKARDEFLDRDVAIKILKRELGQDIETVQKFKQEAAAIAQLNHPNIAKVYTFGEQKGQPYLAMEYLPGDSLKDMMDKDDQLDELFVMQVGADIAKALEAASEMSLVHGDVKPENIAFDEKSSAKLVDFGLATFGKGRADEILGTPYYIAPEKVLLQRADTRSDMYSLGATLYHALAGTPPFTGNNPAECAKARLKKDPPPITRYRKKIHPEVSKVIMRLLQRNPDSRYPTYTSLAADMNRIIKILGGGKKVPPRKTTHQKQSPVKTTHQKRLSPPIKTTPPVRRAQAKTARQPQKSVGPSQSATIRQQSDSGAGSKTPVIVAGIIITVIVILGIILSSIKNQKQPARATVPQAAAQTQAVKMSAPARQALENIANRIRKSGDNIKSAVADIKKLNSEVAIVLDSSIAKELNLHNQIISARAKASTKILSAVSEIDKNAKTLFDSISNTQNAQTARLDMADLSELAVKIEKLETTVNKLLEECQTADKERKKILEDISRTKLAEQDAMEKAEKAQEEAREKAEKAAAEKKAADEKKQQETELTMKQELELIPVAYEKVTQLIQVNEFEKALDGTINQKFSFKTEKSREEIQPLITRCGRLKRWKDWITKQFMAAPLPNGWSENGTKYDIETANETGIRLRGGNGFVLWRNIPSKGLLGYFNYFITNERLQPELEAELQLSAMTYAFLTDNLTAIKIYYDRAVTLDPALAKDQDVLLMAAKVRETTEQLQATKKVEIEAQNELLRKEQEEREKRLAPLQKTN